jgi:hypothetical protein
MEVDSLLIIKIAKGRLNPNRFRSSLDVVYNAGTSCFRAQRRPSMLPANRASWTPSLTTFPREFTAHQDSTIFGFMLDFPPNR